MSHKSAVRKSLRFVLLCGEYESERNGPRMIY